MAAPGNPAPRDPSDPSPSRGRSRRGTARILVVGGEAAARARLVERLADRKHRCTHVGRLDDALTAVRDARYEVVLIHPSLPDGDGLDLVSFIRDKMPATKPIVFGRGQTVASTLAAVRHGAVDVVTEPGDLRDFVERVEHALVRSSVEQRREERLKRLQQVSRELEESRDDLNGQVDQLCREMAHAYEELATQLDEVAMSTEFRTLMRMELDVEEALRTALEYMLTKTGPMNAAVFLPDLDGRYSLGAYVNYDCPRQTIDPVLNRLAKTACPGLANEPAIMRFRDEREFSQFADIDDPVFDGSDVTAFACRHDGECLAIAILFRSNHDPFPATLTPTLDTLRTIFAEHLARIIDIHHRSKPTWPDEIDERLDDPFDEDEPDWGFGGLAA